MPTNKPDTLDTNPPAMGPATSGSPLIAPAPPDAQTYWDKVNLGRWGAYLCQTEVDAIRQAHALAGKPSTGVDLGCGSGRLSSLLSNLGWSITCIDVDKQSLSICRRNVPEAKFILTDATARTIPVDSNSAGILMCIEAPLLDMDWFLPEANRVLAQGGLLAGVWTNRSSLRGLVWNFKNKLKRPQNPMPFYTSSYSSWKERLAASQYEMLYENGFSWGPFSRGSNSILVPFVVKLERLLRLNRWTTASPWIVFVARKTT